MCVCVGKKEGKKESTQKFRFGKCKYGRETREKRERRDEMKQGQKEKKERKTRCDSQKLISSILSAKHDAAVYVTPPIQTSKHPETFAHVQPGEP